MRNKLNGRQKNSRSRRTAKQPIRRRTPNIETLEPRHMLSASPLFDSPLFANARFDSPLFAKAAAAATKVSEAVAPATPAKTPNESGANVVFMTVDEIANLASNERRLFDTSAWQSLSSKTPDGLRAILDRESAWNHRIGEQLKNADISTQQIDTLFLPNDEYLEHQWYLINQGQLVSSPAWEDLYGVAGEDINILPVWAQDVTGEGIIIGVVDTGVQISHPDLAANIHPIYQYHPASGGNDAVPDLSIPENSHGTAIAGIIAGVGGNGIGITGVAPNAQIAPIRIWDDPAATFENQTDTLINIFSYNLQAIPIFNHSWGPSDDTRAAVGPTGQVAEALRDSIRFGRGGLGTIHVFAAGNGAGPELGSGFDPIGIYDSAQFNGYVNSRYTIGVAAVDHDGNYNNSDGTVTAYSEASSAVLVSAPAGSNLIDIGIDPDNGSGIWAPDFLGEDGINYSPLFNGFEVDRDFFDDLDYTTRFANQGNSTSAAIVSGVIALMLEVNPNLSYRDVQEILVRSARQNAPFEIPENGGGSHDNENPWIINSDPLFRDNNPFSPNPSADYPVFYDPVPLDPYWDPMTFNPFRHVGNPERMQPRPVQFMTGSGYTVANGRGSYGDEHGYGHGVVDARLAVEMARQWHDQGQNLPDELTYTTFFEALFGAVVLAAERTSDENGRFLIPGAINLPDGAGFNEFFNEFFVDVEIDEETGERTAGPFSDDDPPSNTRGDFLEFSVPETDLMSIEWVEVKLVFNATTGSTDINHLRMTLISPDGTQSELNPHFINAEGITQPGIEPEFGPADFGTIPQRNPGTGDFVWTFTTNRHWGSRSDDDITINPATGEPWLITAGWLAPELEGVSTDLQNDAILKETPGWQLHMENYGSFDIGLEAIEMVWHGSPLAEDTERVQGFVGIDENTDGDFNFTRAIQTTFDPGYGQVFRRLDTNQESFAAGVTVVASQVVGSNLVEVDRFITGDDGNFYFDLVPGEYIISVEDSLGRTAGDEADVPDGTLSHYRNEWHITEDWFTVHEKVVDNLGPFGDDIRSMVDETGTPVPFTWSPDDFEFTTGMIPIGYYGVKNLNFLLDPGAPAANEIVVTGFTFQDFGEDGDFDGDDLAASGVTVFADLNSSGSLDAGEPIDVSASDGSYVLTIPTSTTGIFKIQAIAPVDWNPTVPFDSITSIFGSPGDTLLDINFGFNPFPTVENPATINGKVFNDDNGDGVQNGGESGMSGRRVFVDVDMDASFDSWEPNALTAADGTYSITDVNPGQVKVYVAFASPLILTTPIEGFHLVTVSEGGTANNIRFGLRDLAVNDWGDLPGPYATLAADNGPRHRVQEGFYLGGGVDGEVDGQPHGGALGDDLAGLADEDGFTFHDPFEAGTTVDLTVVANTTGGYLQGWADFNHNFVFEASERIFTEVLLAQGDNDLSIFIPATVTEGPLALRFRYAESGVNAPTGFALGGEVEDYIVDVVNNTSTFNPADFDADGDVDGDDFLIWQSHLGMSSGATAADGDGDGDGDVDGDDFLVWQANLGATGGGGSVGQAPTAPVAEGGAKETNSLDSGKLRGSVLGGVDFAGWKNDFGSKYAIPGAGTIRTDAEGAFVESGSDLVALPRPKLGLPPKAHSTAFENAPSAKAILSDAVFHGLDAKAPTDNITSAKLVEPVRIEETIAERAVQSVSPARALAFAEFDLNVKRRGQFDFKTEEVTALLAADRIGSMAKRLDAPVFDSVVKRRM